MLVYKLTDEQGQTRNATQWGPGVTHKAHGSGRLCSRGWLHFYLSPELAVFLNPIHGEFDPATMRLWEANANGRALYDHQLKGGCTRLTTIREIAVPPVTPEGVRHPLCPARHHGRRLAHLGVQLVDR
jgi:hypothetical protein